MNKKKIIFVAIAIIIVLTVLAVTVLAFSKYKAVDIMNAIVGNDTYLEENDLNGDKKVDVLDAILAMKQGDTVEEEIEEVQYRYRDKEYYTTKYELNSSESWILYSKKYSRELLRKYNNLNPIEVKEKENDYSGNGYYIEKEVDGTIYKYSTSTVNSYMGTTYYFSSPLVPCNMYGDGIIYYYHPTNNKKLYNQTTTSSYTLYVYSNYMYTYWRWGEWSEWSDTPVTATEDREVEVRYFYSIDYDANGGTGAPEPQTKTYGVDITLSNTIPSREGYNFVGWSTIVNGTVEYNAGDVYSTNARTTLYAIWEANTYTITYDANGGTGAPESQTKMYGEDITFSSTIPTREGYAFNGWATTVDGSVAYHPSEEYGENASITLYAVWAVNTYTITYDANGGTGAPESQTKTYGENITLSNTIPTKQGHTFKGWSTIVNGSVEYSAGDIYSIEESITLYAVWEINTYSISYNANGGINAPNSQTKTYGIDITLSSNIPTREGYTFKGWSTTVDGSVAYHPSEKYGENANITLYAVWHSHIYDNDCDTNCNECGEIRETEHLYGEWNTTKEATCLTNGSKYKECNICGNKVIESVPSIGSHTYTESVTQPTCTKQGYTIYTCSICGYNYKGTFTGAKGHNYDNSCDTLCNVCNATRPPNHSFGIWTEFDVNNHKRTCKCGAVETKPHNWDDGTITIHPTYNTYGELTYTCEDCSAIKTKRIDKVSNVASGKCGENLTWVLATNGILSVTGDGTMYDWESYDYVPWVSYKESIKTVIVENGAFSVGKYAFSNLKNLTSITISDSVKSIADKAFTYSSALVSVTLPSSMNSIGEEAFAYCYSLTSIDIPDGITSIKYQTFSDCRNLTSISIPDSVKTIEYGALGGCKSLTTVTLPNGLISIGGYAFSGCENLTSIVIPNKVTKIIGYAFWKCSNLSSVAFTSSVKRLDDYAFGECGKLNSVFFCGTESQWNELVTIMGVGNYKLTKATISYHNWIEDSITTSKKCLLCNAIAE